MKRIGLFPEPRCALLVAALLAVPCAPVRAAPRLDAYQQHYNQGLARYGDGDYAAAVREFEAAYELRPRPRLLFNIGQSYRLLRNYPQALRYYHLYINMEKDPKPGLQSEVDRYIAELVELVCRASDLAPEVAKLCPSTAAPSAVPAVAGTSLPLTLTPVLASQPAAVPAGAFAITTTAAPPARAPLYRRWWFWTAVGGGAAVLATSIGLGVALSNQRNCGNAWCPTF